MNIVSHSAFDVILWSAFQSVHGFGMWKLLHPNFDPFQVAFSSINWRPGVQNRISDTKQIFIKILTFYRSEVSKKLRSNMYFLFGEKYSYNLSSGIVNTSFFFTTS